MIAINDGVRTLGLLKRVSNGFEIFVVRDGRHDYLAKCESVAQATAILRSGMEAMNDAGGGQLQAPARRASRPAHAALANPRQQARR